MFEKSKRNDAHKELLLAEENAEQREMVQRILRPQEVEGAAIVRSAHPPATEAISSISSGLSIVGKIVGNGRLAIFGHVEGEVHASTVQIGDGAHVEGNIVAEELTIGGRVKGTIRANRVKLNSTAVVEGDIYHRSLAIEENAQFEGMSTRRQENAIDTPSLDPANISQARPVLNDGDRKGNGASNSLNPSRWIIGGSHRKQAVRYQRTFVSVNACPLYPRKRTFAGANDILIGHCANTRRAGHESLRLCMHWGNRRRDHRRSCAR